jgi:exodeoxyribonuclease III
VHHIIYTIMKLITWNVNGLRSIAQKDKDGIKGKGGDNVIKTLMQEYSIDILCLQETKCPGECKVDIPVFEASFILDSKTKKGYSGVAIMSHTIPVDIRTDFPLNEEGRVLCFEFSKYYIVNAYVPNSKPDLSRLEYRVNVWEKAIRTYINELQKNKPVIFVGDFNVAPTEIDIHNPKNNDNAHGFTMQERKAFQQLKEECKLVDAYRVLHPKTIKYSWFSPFAKSRANNKGWRLDMILVSEKLKNKVQHCDILNNIFGSDHCPVIVDIDI